MGGFLCPLPVCAPCAAGLRACSIFNFFAFAFSCLTFASQNSFHLSLMPRRAPHFLLRKENGGKEPRGERRTAPLPFEPHSCALRPIFSSFALLAGLRGLSAANRRLTGKRLKSQGAELSFSSVSVRRGTPVPFRRSPPFSRCWPAYAAFQAANRRLTGETPEKPRSKAQLFGRFCASGTLRGFCPGGFLPAAGNRRWDFSLPEETGAQRGPAPGINRGRARRGEEKDTERDLLGAAARLAHRRCERPTHHRLHRG